MVMTGRCMEGQEQCGGNGREQFSATCLFLHRRRRRRFIRSYTAAQNDVNSFEESCNAWLPVLLPRPLYYFWSRISLEPRGFLSEE